MSITRNIILSKLLKLNKHDKLNSIYFSVSSIQKTNLKEVIAKNIPIERDRIMKFRKKHGNTELGKITLNMVYGGMRGMLGMVWETSTLDINKGVVFRGYSIPDIYECFPKIENEPIPEALFWFLCTGNIPNMDDINGLSKEWAKRSTIPKHVETMLKNFPKTLHPMSQLSACVTALNHDSKFNECYPTIKRTEQWEYVYEDCMDLIAKLPVIAAAIYLNTYKSGKGEIPKIDPNADWGKNFAVMLGYNDPCFIELMRMYLTIHCDHGGGNVSAHATHLVGSALADPYLSFAAGLNGLAGPLHGLANQEVLTWLQQMRKEIGENPDKQKIEDFIQTGLKAGRVVPGYGHAVLRITDPRYTCQREFALKFLPDDELFKMVSTLYDIVPPILKALGKVKNPWPNVDAHSGVLLYHYGMIEMSYYTVLFGVSRALGVLAHAILGRTLGLPIERPNSEPTDILMKLAEKAAAK